VLTKLKEIAYLRSESQRIPIAEKVPSLLKKLKEQRQKINRVLDKSLDLSGENRMWLPLQGCLYLAALQVNQALLRR
jgi:hypothetical protein